MTPPLANPLQPLIDVFEPILVALHDVTGSWGMAIVSLTVVVRAALLPLAIKQYRSMRALAELAPEIKKIQSRFKDDKQRQQQEVMKFYQENKVNPFASCLPILFQLPVFFALFYLLREDLKIEICGDAIPANANLGQITCDAVAEGSAKFLFIPDLTDNATGTVLLALIVLYVGSQLLSSILMMSATVDKTQRMIFIALPFFFIPFIISFPAGLLVYWITTNLWTVAQQYTLRKVYGAPKIPERDPNEPSGLTALFKQATGQASEPASAGNGAPARKKEKAAAGARPAPRASGPPPPSPRKKKKRSGRRR
jgi:YidC/Oxa1 family membrane protein insertase